MYILFQYRMKKQTRAQSRDLCTAANFIFTVVVFSPPPQILRYPPFHPTKISPFRVARRIPPLSSSCSFCISRVKKKFKIYTP